MSTDVDALRSELDDLRRRVDPPKSTATCWLCGVRTERIHHDGAMAASGHPRLCGDHWKLQPSAQSEESRGGAALAIALGVRPGPNGSARQRRYANAREVARRLKFRAWIDANVPPCDEPFGYVTAEARAEAERLLASLEHPPPPRVGDERVKPGTSPTGRYAPVQLQRFDGTRWFDLVDDDAESRENGGDAE